MHNTERSTIPWTESKEFVPFSNVWIHSNYYVTDGMVVWNSSRHHPNAELRRNDRSVLVILKSESICQHDIFRQHDATKDVILDDSWNSIYPSSCHTAPLLLDSRCLFKALPLSLGFTTFVACHLQSNALDAWSLSRLERVVNVPKISHTPVFTGF